jgi:hypothetical protein
MHIFYILDWKVADALSLMRRVIENKKTANENEWKERNENDRRLTPARQSIVTLSLLTMYTIEKRREKKI